MKLKKIFTALVLFTVGFSSLSALTIRGKDIGEFEIGINQGFPIEFEKPDDADMTSIFYAKTYDSNILITSTGFDLMWTARNNIGVFLSLDFGYSNAQKGYTESTFMPNALCAFRTTASSIYFKIAPAFKLGNGTFNVILTPGIVFSNLTMRTKESYEDGSNLNFRITYGFPFGLGIGVKGQYNINRYIGLNIGLDVDLMLVNCDATGRATYMGESSTQSLAVPHEILLNVMPKIGITTRF